MTDEAAHQRVLIDTGPLVAMRITSDSEHQRCIQTLARIELPLLTCWPVITEAAWMLRRNIASVRRLLRSIADGRLRLLDVSDADVPAIDDLFRRYADLKPQLADLALLHLANREGLDTVFTLDRRDFAVFRLKGRKPLRLLPAANE